MKAERHHRGPHEEPTGLSGSEEEETARLRSLRPGGHIRPGELVNPAHRASCVEHVDCGIHHALYQFLGCRGQPGPPSSQGARGGSTLFSSSQG